MKSKKAETDSGESLGIVVEPDAIYTADDCRKILNNCSRSTLTKYVEEGFPLRPINTGIAVGREIVEWISSRPVRKQRRGRPAKA